MVSLRAKCRHVHSERFARLERLKNKISRKLKIARGRHRKSPLGRVTKGVPATMDCKAPRVGNLCPIQGSEHGYYTQEGLVAEILRGCISHIAPISQLPSLCCLHHRHLSM